MPNTTNKAFECALGCHDFSGYVQFQINGHPLTLNACKICKCLLAGNGLETTAFWEYIIKEYNKTGRIKFSIDEFNDIEFNDVDTARMVELYGRY